MFNGVLAFSKICFHTEFDRNKFVYRIAKILKIFCLYIGNHHTDIEKEKKEHDGTGTW